MSDLKHLLDGVRRGTVSQAELDQAIRQALDEENATHSQTRLHTDYTHTHRPASRPMNSDTPGTTGPEPESESNTVYGIPVLFFGLKLGAFGGPVAQWLLEVSNTGKLSPHPLAGSITMLVVGAIGLVFAMLRLGHWAQVPLILCAWFVDQTLSSLLIAPFDLQSSHELLSAWPFILTTLSTAVVAGVLAFALPDRPYFYGVSMVSLDLVMAWVFRAAAPFALTPSLIARLVSAYGAAVFGASLGKRIRLLTKRGAGQARQFAREVVIEVAGGMLVALAVYWLLPA